MVPAPESRSRSAGSPPETWSASATIASVSAASASRASRRTSQTPPGGLSRWATSRASLVLPTPPGPTTVTRRCAATAESTAATSSLPADGRRLHRGQIPRGARTAGLQLGAVLQDLLVQRLQAHPRIDAELVGQQLPHRRVRRQRLGLPAGLIERLDQRGPETLAERMLLDQRPQLGDNLATRSQLDASRHGVLDQAQPHFLETIPVRRGPIADAGQHGSAEERQPLEGPLQRRAVVTRGPGRRTPGGEPGHPERIHRFRRHREDVAVARGHHGVAVAQRLTQLGDLRLERVASRRSAPQAPPGAGRPAPDAPDPGRGGPTPRSSCPPAAPPGRRRGKPRRPLAPTR